MRAHGRGALPAEAYPSRAPLHNQVTRAIRAHKYGLLWDSAAWTLANSPASLDELIFHNSSAGASTASFCAATSGDHRFYINVCDGFGCGTGLSLVLTDQQAGEKIVVQDWQLRNLSDAMSGIA